MISSKRTAFFISDSTGITAEVMGDSLLIHFPSIEFKKITLAYIDTEEKALQAVEKINAAAAQDGQCPIVFETLINEKIRATIKATDSYCIDVINKFLSPLEEVLGPSNNDNVGRPKIATADKYYNRRMAAVNFSLENDDGLQLDHYDEADIILIGVSRSGKTPTCLYMAMQFGIFPANYPITEDDLDQYNLPKALAPYKKKLFGLTINPDRLVAIRTERMASSRYASLNQCQQEIDQTQRMYDQYGIPSINTTDCSIEEIATRILSETGMERHFN